MTLTYQPGATSLFAGGLDRSDYAVFKIHVLRSIVAVVINPLLMSPIGAHRLVDFRGGAPCIADLLCCHPARHASGSCGLNHALFVRCQWRRPLNIEFLPLLSSGTWFFLKRYLSAWTHALVSLCVRQYGKKSDEHRCSYALHTEPFWLFCLNGSRALKKGAHEPL